MHFFLLPSVLNATQKSLQISSYKELYFFYFLDIYKLHINLLIDMMLAFHSTLSLYKIKQGKNINVIVIWFFFSSNIRHYQ